MTVDPFGVGSGRCYDKCNACGHLHGGVADRYACPRCSCSDTFTPDEPEAA